MTQLEQDFDQFDAENPEVWNLFVRFALELIKAGRTRLSASLVIERIRWETAVATRSENGFKINNNYTAYYARKFNENFPDCGASFALRQTKGQELLSL